MSNEPIVIEQTFDVPIRTVWNAITVVDEMRQWYFDTIAAFEPVVGFETQFNVHCDGKGYLHLWKVTAVEPLQSITYQWRYGGFDGDSSVRWELSESDGGTTLKLTHTGAETIEGDVVFSRENCIGGWTFLVKQSLKAYLGTKV